MEKKDIIIRGTKEIPVVVLNRVEKNNQLSIPMMRMTAGNLKILVDEGAKVIILTNNGDYFCSGGELGDFTQKTSMEIREFGEAFIELHKTIYNLPIPVIAAIKGNAHGGGFSLFESCDLAVAADSVTFAVPEITAGLAPMMALTGIKRSMTKKKALELALLGKVVSAGKALEMGLINWVTAIDDVEPKATEVAEKIAGSNPTAIKLCKDLYNALDNLTYDKQLNEGLAYLVSLLKSGDAEKAYIAKNSGLKPEWCSK